MPLYHELYVKARIICVGAVRGYEVLAYCYEMCFRFKRRKNLQLFRDTMLKLIDSPNIEHKQLTAKVQNAV